MVNTLLSVRRKPVLKKQVVSSKYFSPYRKIDFFEVDKKAKQLADLIEVHFEKLTDILLRYESFEVVQDEVNRALDLLRNLRENKKFFFLRVGAVASFLPRNQPLYAFSCFVIVPSLMASEVHFRIPQSMMLFFQDMLDLLEIKKLFPNIFVSQKQRSEFLRERSALLVNPKTKESIPATEAVIFTGLPSHASKLRFIFDKRTLFISNGAGHNPVVVSKDANLNKAIEAVLTLGLYNQGQDCAAPNAVLVHKDILPNFLRQLREGLSKVKIGSYNNKSSRVGPISDPDDLVRIEDFLIKNREWLDSSTKGVIRTSEAIVEPTIICKPLRCGGNYNEIFAPTIFVQEYADNSELASYFENDRYLMNAMYVTLYGTSNYINKLIGKIYHGKLLHDKSSFIHNTHLHARGVERGINPYGGYGYGASSLSINGKIITMPTLPQRDIYKWIVKPILNKKTLNFHQQKYDIFTKIQEKDIGKLLKLKLSNSSDSSHDNINSNNIYLDLDLIKDKKSRFIHLNPAYSHTLLEVPNVKYIVSMTDDDIKLIKKLNKLLDRKSKLNLNKFITLLYALPKSANATEERNIANQRIFFQNLYQLLFGKKSGPKLTNFLWEIDKSDIKDLLDV
ncbi:MAG: Lysyl-tRNA synthetase (Class I) [Parcubacteria group bacterium GW2011_GWB1_38_8]|uniref:Aldehyde dehydrogenase domain-containing protein n=1 Tax=Candidatus Zambryskibacteria bacterium RIFCSPLOWO2_02_FULL_39_14 TaxID=1802769 RepID=A0A1G2UF14_9BACT|nr:MAG: Lysyl-tRNA synthetase (Class I) [Parcubacteria group bacterium GW2011_GWB1_38_8]KKR31032.1 MAG: Lysyl-tRNA synthetase (Class I) [Parcubacteria group bacterium GW2011_GWC1_39_8]OHA95641.1 MAG: hypothetical protein A3C62_01630 [Candidatus Zambryskibacteria bacterium RIFCSPHIGHO2_02_FULL_39_16]OHB08029.1 MAG: hypothetical protein A3I86_01465 [Candidatus Zambryskibacteria bacterium RIFCSPLOWO2_02_FULL_39_14]